MKTLTQKIFLLSPPGGLFDESVVRNLFPALSQGARNSLIHRAVESGEVQRLKRGLYLLSEPFRKTAPHPFAVAPMLYGPSAISLESALAFHGLIPEAVYQTTSTTTKRACRFSTSLGDFIYHLRKEVEWKKDGIAFLTESMRMEPGDLAALPLESAEEIINAIRNQRTKEYLQNLKREISK